MRRGKPSLGRKKPHRREKPVFWIFTDGQNTERSYFSALSKSLGMPVGVPKKCGGKSPDEVVKTALAKRKEEKDSYDASRDEFWVVFDDDGRAGVTQARSRCANSGLKTAISNPCFEVWLLLHITDYDCPDDQATVQRKLELQCPAYERDRQKVPNMEALLQNLEYAEQRAEQMDSRRVADGDPNGRPSTRVYKLTRALRSPSR